MLRLCSRNWSAARSATSVRPNRRNAGPLAQKGGGAFLRLGPKSQKKFRASLRSAPGGISHLQVNRAASAFPGLRQGVPRRTSTRLPSGGGPPCKGAARNPSLEGTAVTYGLRVAGSHAYRGHPGPEPVLRDQHTISGVSPPDDEQRNAVASLRAFPLRSGSRAISMHRRGFAPERRAAYRRCTTLRRGVVGITIRFSSKTSNHYQKEGIHNVEKETVT